MKTAEEFWIKVDKSGDCWEWQGGLNNTGYGTVNWWGATVTAHRLAAFLSGLVDSPKAPTDRKGSGFVLHKCDNRRCCKPKHLDVGTYTENQKDAYRKKRKTQPKGGDHANAKLSNGQAAYVRALYSTGEWRQQDLADLMGVSQLAVSNIVRGKTYV